MRTGTVLRYPLCSCLHVIFVSSCAFCGHPRKLLLHGFELLEHLIEAALHRVNLCFQGIDFGLLGFDLVILNMVMPGMDGVQLFETLEKIDPDIKVIITTGCAVDDRVSNLIAGGRHGCLQKPFGRADLARMIQQVLSPFPCDDGQRFNILQF